MWVIFVDLARFVNPSSRRSTVCVERRGDQSRTPLRFLNELRMRCSSAL
ncbi:hypothetical protein GGD41_007503 [Paraburkholderia bryophila]|uniref:Uncharacterized protein n=1 Tax=Paraburkholderia bryophila TaxID=420952 RepID=A0A7Y9WI38_9BURK|nr:hypothetical protein [Paraburkholderia bryophila]NYH20698.1 hypothetical protein [Paraburkholderia bryophila]